VKFANFNFLFHTQGEGHGAIYGIFSFVVLGVLIYFLILL